MKRNQHVLSEPKKFVAIRKILHFLFFYFYFLLKHFATTKVRKSAAQNLCDFWNLLKKDRDCRRQKPQTLNLFACKFE